MNMIHKQRLLNVAKACRETAHVAAFNMGHWGFNSFYLDQDNSKCGTPACALGNYAFRRDLQHTFKLSGDIITLSDGGDAFKGKIHAHFAITINQFEELFGSIGCGEALTHEEAATYIEKFVVKQCMGESA